MSEYGKYYNLNPSGEYFTQWDAKRLLEEDAERLEQQRRVAPPMAETAIKSVQALPEVGSDD